MSVIEIKDTADYWLVEGNLKANSDKIPIYNLIEAGKINIDVSGTFVATVAIKAGRSANDATVRALTTTAGFITADLLNTDRYAEVVVTAYTSGTVIIGGEVKKKDLSVEDLQTGGIESPVFAEGLSVEKWTQTLNKLSIANNGTVTAIAKNPVTGSIIYGGGNETTSPTLKACLYRNFEITPFYTFASNYECVKGIAISSNGVIVVGLSRNAGDGDIAYSVDMGKTFTIVDTGANYSEVLYMLFVGTRLVFSVQNSSTSRRELKYIEDITVSTTIVSCTVPVEIMTSGTQLFLINNKLFCGVRHTDATTAGLLESTDGITWTLSSLAFNEKFTTLQSISYCNQKYYGVGLNTSNFWLAKWTEGATSIEWEKISESNLSSTSIIVDYDRIATVAGNTLFYKDDCDEYLWSNYQYSPDTIESSFVYSIDSILYITCGSTAYTDGDIYYAPTFYNLTNINSVYTKVSSPKSWIQVGEHGIRSNQFGNMTQFPLGTFPTWADAVSFCSANATTLMDGVVCTIKQVVTGQGTGGTAYWDSATQKLVPSGNWMVYKADLSTVVGAGEVNTDKLVGTFYLPKSLVQNAKRKINHKGVIVYSTSTSGAKGFVCKISTSWMIKRMPTTTSLLADIGGDVVVADDFRTYALASASFVEGVGGAGSLVLNTAFQGADSLVQVDIYLSSAVAETINLYGFQVTI